MEDDVGADDVFGAVAGAVVRCSGRWGREDRGSLVEGLVEAGMGYSVIPDGLGGDEYGSCLGFDGS